LYGLAAEKMAMINDLETSAPGPPLWTKTAFLLKTRKSTSAAGPESPNHLLLGY